MKKTMRVIACLLVAVLMLTVFAACDWEGGGMKLTEEEWNSAFEAAKKWENYNLTFRLDLNKNYEIDEKHGIFNSGDFFMSETMQFILDRANPDGARMHSNMGSSYVDDEGTWVDDGYRRYDALEKGKLFSYYEIDDHLVKSEAYVSEGKTPSTQFDSYVQTLEDFLPWFVFTADGKTLQLDELNTVLKYSKDSHEYEGKLGFELKPNGDDESIEGENPFKTDSATVAMGVCNTKYNAEYETYERSNELPEDWSKWEGEIYLYLKFETEYMGEKVLCTVELRYEWIHYSVNLPEYIYKLIYEDGERRYESYKNVLGQV